MATIVERALAAFGLQKAATTQPPFAAANGSIGGFTVVTGDRQSARSTALLRNYADRNEAVRTAINWRKQQITGARYRIVRTDDPKAKPDKRVVAAAAQLLGYVNPSGDSFRSLLDKVVEDLIVLDAGCIEKEMTLGGPSKETGCKIAALWAADGSTIGIDPRWAMRKSDGGFECDPDKPRYHVYDRATRQEIGTLRNDQLVYMQQTPTTHRLLGLSQVETLVRVIEAELYGEEYDFNMLRRALPPGLLDLPGLSDQQRKAYETYYRSEIEGTGRIAIWNRPDVSTAAAPNFLRFGLTPSELQRGEYKNWLINKISMVFQCDKTIFGLVDDVNRSNGQVMSERTDQGFVALARLVAEYFTREIIREIDPNHGFEFIDLTVRDPLVQAKIDDLYVKNRVLLPNEMRAERFGLDPYEGGDEPFPVPGSTPLPDPTDDPNAEPDPVKPADDPKKALSTALIREGEARMRFSASPTVANLETWEACERDVEAAKSDVPFVAAPKTARVTTRAKPPTQRPPAPMPNARSGYLNS